MNKFLIILAVAVSGVVSYLVAARIVGEMPHQYDVGNGTVLKMHVEGKSGPVVILEMVADPTLVMDLAKNYRVVEYQRAGWGDSFVEGSKRDAVTVATELHTGLAKLGVPPPYYLVGDKIGSLYARKFSQTYSNEVKGVVLLNPYVEEPAPKTRVNELKQLDPASHSELVKVLEEIAAQAGLTRDYIEATRAHERIKVHHILAGLRGEEKRKVKEAIDNRFHSEESTREIYGFITGFKGAEKDELLSFPASASQLRQGAPSQVPTTVITTGFVPTGLPEGDKLLVKAEQAYLFDEHEKMKGDFTHFNHLRSAKASENIVDEDPELLLETLKKMTAN